MGHKKNGHGVSIGCKNFIVNKMIKRTPKLRQYRNLRKRCFKIINRY